MAGSLVAVSLPRNQVLSISTGNQADFLAIVGDDPRSPAFEEIALGDIAGPFPIFLDAKDSLVYSARLTGDVFFIFLVTLRRAQWFQLRLTQDGVGNRKVGSIRFQFVNPDGPVPNPSQIAKVPGGGLLPLSTAPNATDIVSGYWPGTDDGSGHPLGFAQIAGLDFK